MARDKRNERQGEHWTKMHRRTMETEAWRALSSLAQALYVWARLEWSGPNPNNNGKIYLSSRQAGKAMGRNHKTAAKGFQELQAKGFLHVTVPCELGVEGSGKSHLYEITELPLPGAKAGLGRCLFRNWKPGNDFEVIKPSIHNPNGSNGKTKPCPKKRNGTVLKFGTKS